MAMYIFTSQINTLSFITFYLVAESNKLSCPSQCENEYFDLHTAFLPPLPSRNEEKFPTSSKSKEAWRTDITSCPWGYLREDQVQHFRKQVQQALVRELIAATYDSHVYNITFQDIHAMHKEALSAP